MPVLPRNPFQLVQLRNESSLITYMKVRNLYRIWPIDSISSWFLSSKWTYTLEKKLKYQNLAHIPSPQTPILKLLYHTTWDHSIYKNRQAKQSIKDYIGGNQFKSKQVMRHGLGYRYILISKFCLPATKQLPPSPINLLLSPKGRMFPSSAHSNKWL